MENATKALLIAGAILIAIILIAIGVKLVSTSAKIKDQAENVSSTLEASVFNTQFTKFFGTNISSSEACSLLSTIYVSNAQDTSHIVRICLRDSENKKIIFAHDQTTLKELQQAIQEIYQDINRKKDMTYTIKVTPNCTHSPNHSGYDDGYIICISITENY